MTGRPTILVQLDDGSGTFPFNVTAYVDLTEGYSITRGRTDRFDSIQPSTLSMTLDNSDGRFAPGSAQYGIYAEQMIRVTESVGATSSVRFTGYVTEWPVEWPNGMTKMSTVRIAAVDRLARFARRTFRSTIEEEYLQDAMLAYFPLGESADVGAGADIAGSNPPLVITAGRPGDVEFGSSKPDFGTNFVSVNELSQVAFGNQGSGNPGGYLTGSVAGVRGGNLRIEFLFSSRFFGGQQQQLIRLDFGSSSLAIYTDDHNSASGTFHVERYSGTTSFSLINTTAVGALADHHVMVTETGGVRTIYIDGVNRGSDNDVSPTGPFTSNLVVGFGGWAQGTQMAHVVVGKAALTVSSLADHNSVCRFGFAGDSVGARVSRYLDYFGFPANRRQFNTTVQHVPHVPIAGLSTLDAIENLMRAERSVAYIQGDGQFFAQNRTARNLNATGTPTLTVTSDQVDGDASLILDMQQVRNYVTVTRLNGTIQTAQDDTSIARHDRYPDDYSDLAVMSDAEALSFAQNLVTKYAEPLPRMPSVGLDALSLPTALQQSVLRLDISSYIRLSNLPSQARLPNVGLLVEGWTETVSTNEWRLVANTSSASIEL